MGCSPSNGLPIDEAMAPEQNELMKVCHLETETIARLSVRTVSVAMAEGGR